MEDTPLLELPPRKAFADSPLRAEPAKLAICTSFRFPLRRREAMLRRLVPEQGLAGLDLTAELAGVPMLAGDSAGPRVPRQLIRPGSRDGEEHGFSSVSLQVLSEADIRVHRPEVRVARAPLRLMPPRPLVEWCPAVLAGAPAATQSRAAHRPQGCPPAVQMQSGKRWFLMSRRRPRRRGLSAAKTAKSRSQPALVNSPSA